MKKRTLLILALISIIVMVAGTAMTNNASAYTLIYLGAHLSGKQMVFVFSYEGSVPNSVLKSASAVGIGGNSDGGVTLHCVRQEEKKQIRCTVGKALHYNYIHLYLGYTSVGWAPVPEYRPAESQNCPYFFLFRPILFVG